MWRLMISLVAILVMSQSAGAQQVLRQYTWEGADPATRHAVSETGEVVGGVQKVRDLQEITIEGRADASTTREILVIEGPNITADNYAIKGMVRYSNVASRGGQKACLEMWSYFGDGSSYFSRTLADSGPLQNLEGSSDWREFLLPFYNKPGGPRPVHLVVKAVLPGQGSMAVRTAELVQFAIAPPPADLEGNSREVTRNMIGMSILPLVILFVIAAIFLARAGVARRFVYTLWTIHLLLAIFIVGWSVAMFLPGVPAPLPPALIAGLGLVSVGVVVVEFFGLRHWYARAALRKISALDAQL